MSILIIDGSGYIGSYTIKYFLQSEDVIVVDNYLKGLKKQF